jgi:phosphatidylglycerol:prolipoprotein diacylglycerol transferase
MYPKLLDLGPLSIYTYGLLLAASYLLGLQLALRRARPAGLDPGKVMDLGIWVIVAALVGAKLLLVVVDLPHFIENPGDLFSLARSAGVFYGGLILAVIVGLALVRRYHLPVWTTGDVYAPGIALGHVVGRMGCFAAGCCYGREAHVPWAVTFTNPLASQFGTPLNVPLHPTQLYESGAELLILVALLVLEKRGRPFPGRTFWGYVAAYAVSRFVIEAFRGDARGLVFGTLSTSQAISLLLLPLSIAMLVYLSRRPVATPAAVSPRRPRTA